MTYIHWEIQNSFYSYLDIFIELWDLYLFTSVIIRVEYILICSIYASKNILKICKGIKCTKNSVLPHCGRYRTNQLTSLSVATVIFGPINQLSILFRTVMFTCKIFRVWLTVGPYPRHWQGSLAHIGQGDGAFAVPLPPDTGASHKTCTVGP